MQTSSLLTILLTCSALVAVPAQALTPFDITNATARPVTIHFDHNTDNPSLLGADMRFGYTGQWSSNGTTGTITVPPADVAAKLIEINSPGVPTDLQNWTDLVYTVTIATRRITITQDLYVLIPCSTTFFPPDQPIQTYVELNTHLNPLTPKFQFIQLDPGCPPFAFYGGTSGPQSGATKFNYDVATGRFNAAGPITVGGIVPRYGTFGDSQLYEFEAPDVPALSPFGYGLSALLLVASFGLIGGLRSRR